MDSVRFDGLLRSLSSRPSRRGVLAGLTGGLLTSLPLIQRADDAAAKQKTNKGKRKKKAKKKRRNLAATPSPPAPPPSPSGPVTTADAACPPASGVSGTLLFNGERFAQTFRALRGGQLTSASFVLTGNAANEDFVLEIRDVGATGEPVAAVLASTIIADVPETDFGDPPRTVSGTFAAPATVVAGQRYALVVSAPSGQSCTIQTNKDSNPCADGNVFVESEATVGFFASANDDMVFATFVTA